MDESNLTDQGTLGCCPVMQHEPVCDTVRLRYRLPYRPGGDNQGQRPPVELILHFELKRCSGPLVIGDPVYSTTLLPGERVRMFTSDRHSRWSYDSESELSYRHETTSEESFFTASMARAVTDLTISESGVATSSYEESWAEGGGGASVNLFGVVEIGGGGGGGSYDASSTSTFAQNLSRHAEASSSSAAAGVRAKSTTAIGEVESREHAEGESQSQYESSSRMFRNDNRCSAVTYLFHKINKVQRVSFKLVAIERHVRDAAAPVGISQRAPVDVSGRVMVLPRAMPATSSKRLEVEEVARASAVNRLGNFGQSGPVASFSDASVFSRAALAAVPVPPKDRDDAIKQVDRELQKAGMLDDSGQPSKNFVASLSWEREEILPTPGVLVKGCLDDCATCEPSRVKEIELDLERKSLENQKLQREIALLEQSQQYRCCPEGEEEDPEEPVSG